MVSGCYSHYESVVCIQGEDEDKEGERYFSFVTGLKRLNAFYKNHDLSEWNVYDDVSAVLDQGLTGSVDDEVYVSVCVCLCVFLCLYVGVCVSKCVCVCVLLMFVWMCISRSDNLSFSSSVLPLKFAQTLMNAFYFQFIRH